MDSYTIDEHINGFQIMNKYKKYGDLKTQYTNLLNLKSENFTSAQYDSLAKTITTLTPPSNTEYSELKMEMILQLQDTILESRVKISSKTFDVISSIMAQKQQWHKLSELYRAVTNDNADIGQKTVNYAKGELIYCSDPIMREVIKSEIESAVTRASQMRAD